jgi:hypothetical protein
MFCCTEVESAIRHHRAEAAVLVRSLRVSQATLQQERRTLILLEISRLIHHLPFALAFSCPALMTE